MPRALWWSWGGGTFLCEVPLYDLAGKARVLSCCSPWRPLCGYLGSKGTYGGKFMRRTQS